MYDSIIIGAGPAGCAAAVQLKRSDRKILMIEKNQIGGLLRNAWKVENYLGFPDGISGEALVSLIAKQLDRFKIEVKKAEVIEVIREGSLFEVKTPDESMIAKTVIVATGTVPKQHVTPSSARLKAEARIEGRHVAIDNIFYHADDIPEPSDNRKITVIGGGDTAFDSAISLNKKGYEPAIVTRNEVCCLALLKEEAEKRGIKILKSEDYSLENSDCPVLVAIGREPVVLKMPDEGNGLFLVGDVKNGLHRHVHIAAGDGLRAALEVERIIS